ncbi:MAG: SpaA isopeptide-forming pilin-related protein [Magnetococcus sp. WYHC-3]
MGCPSFVIIGNNLKFTICTHDPDTGVLTDADDVPSYRVYEDETSTAILTGSMAKLDDTNTTGFYSEVIACTAANGFEDGKVYSIYITATVDSDTGGISYDFTAYSQLGNATAGSIEWTYTLTDSVTLAPIDGAEVWVTTDSAGTNVVASGTTNASGVVTFYLDAGTYYVWSKKAGYDFSNPDTEIVS